MSADADAEVNFQQANRLDDIVDGLTLSPSTVVPKLVISEEDKTDDHTPNSSILPSMRLPPPVDDPRRNAAVAEVKETPASVPSREPFLYHLASVPSYVKTK